MTVDFRLPHLGENINSADIIKVHVKEGDKISIKQNIGTLNPSDDALSELHFEIRYGKVRQNPADWLSKK